MVDTAKKNLGDIQSGAMELPTTHLPVRDKPRNIHVGLRHQLDTIAASYSRAISLINRKDQSIRGMAHCILSLLTYAMRPLKSAEVRHAVRIATQSDWLGYDDIDQLLGVVAGLATKAPDGTIKLEHGVLRVFLVENWDKFFPDGRQLLAQMCLDVFQREGHDYVEVLESNLRNTNSCDSGVPNPQQRYPFLPYAARFWGVHLCDAGECFEAETMRLLRDRTLVQLCSKEAGNLPLDNFFLPKDGGPILLYISPRLSTYRLSCRVFSERASWLDG